MGRIEIFRKYAEDILEENYKDRGYLYLFGPCDIRWGFKPDFFSLNFINNIKILTVKGKSKEGVSQNCNYLKNPDGNLIMISDKEYKSEIFNQILSTFKFIETAEQTEEISNKEKYCEKDADCACGVNINTGDCFYGNKDYVDTTRQCPDFCTGITGKLVIKCINNECKQPNE